MMTTYYSLHDLAVEQEILEIKNFMVFPHCNYTKYGFSSQICSNHGLETITMRKILAPQCQSVKV